MISIYQKIDLPDRLDPMTVKELRQGLRKGSFLIPFIFVHVFAIVAMVVEFYIDTPPAYDRYTGVMQIFLFFDESPFWWVAGLICMVGMPLGSLLLMSSEMEEGNYELLQMTPLSRWSIVVGKVVAMWSICLLTFSSLLPYMIIRYFIGGMDVWRNFSMALTVVLLSVMICAGGLAASSYKGALKRGLVMMLFCASAYASGMVGLAVCAMRSEGCGLFYHINAFAFVVCYVMLGLVMARSRIRLTVHHYEVKPSWMVIGLLIFTPLVVGMATLVSFGWLSALGFVAMTIVSKFADISPKAPAYKGVANLNIPNPEQASATQLKEADINTNTDTNVGVSHHTSEPSNGSESEEEITSENVLSHLVKPEEKRPTPKFPKVDKENYDGWS